MGTAGTKFLRDKASWNDSKRTSNSLTPSGQGNFPQKITPRFKVLVNHFNYMFIAQNDSYTIDSSHFFCVRHRARKFTFLKLKWKSV